ncbi:MAG: DUF2510 domain-containing protein [Terrimesophilobacter sp.]
MSIDTPSTVIIAGWYPDPTDNTQARWWDGTEWGSATRPRQTEAPPKPAEPVHHNRYFSPVPLRTEAVLPPIDPYRPLNRRDDSQGFVSMGLKPVIKFTPTRAYTGSVWAIATMPIWSTIVVLALTIILGDLYTTFLISITSVTVLVILIAFAIHDQKRMLNSLHPKAASPWWMILSPLIYLIVRGVHVSRTVGHGWAPLIVFLICSFVPAAAILAFGALSAFVLSLLG